jgi:hypothetical protein
MTGTSQTSIKLGRVGGNSQGLIVADIARPNVGVRVHVVTNVSCDGTTTFFQENAAGLFVGSTAFDGFTLLCTSGTITGTVRVYGYNK